VKERHVVLYLLVAGAVILAACSSASTPSPSDPDAQQSEGPVYINQMELLIMESAPIQVSVQIEGELPTPCHELHWEIAEPASANRIDSELFSTAPTDMACIQVLEPFEMTVPLGSFEGGSYEVFVNGEEAGSFDA
jgi:hypothetical protein